ncbi:MAG: hypothetical protein SF029_16200 [bacterium]|nr:hypothetical protein [bacterium]
MIKQRYPLVSFLLFCIFLLWVYAKDRKSESEFEAGLADLYFNDPVIQSLNQERDAWLCSSEGQSSRRRIAEKRLDDAIDVVLAGEWK